MSSDVPSEVTDAIHAADAEPAAQAGSAVAGGTTPAFYRTGEYRPDQSVGYLMRRALNSILAEGDRRLGPHDLTSAQWLPLFKLSVREGCTMASLARDLCTDPGAMTRAMDRLEAKGLIERQRSVEDRRVVNLVLTPEGRQLASKVPPMMAEVLNSHLKGFSQAEWQQLTDLLQRVVANGEALRAAD